MTTASWYVLCASGLFPMTGSHVHSYPQANHKCCLRTSEHHWTACRGSTF